ncbi:hypothetical protein FQR65_LT10995 [Abscondita terminalis]|nr:hypothetical protein FQR65_LT10995 [Abscondita terminalis]
MTELRMLISQTQKNFNHTTHFHFCSPGQTVCHLITLVVVTASGFATAFLVGKGLKGFGNQCVLYANLTFYDANDTSIDYSRRNLKHVELPFDLKQLNFTSTKWSQMYKCYFCQFMPLVSMISAIVWITAFTVCGRGGAANYSDTYSRPWRVVYPSLCFSIVATILMFVSSFQLYKGLKVFCSEFSEVFNTTTCTKDIDFYTAYFNEQPVSSITPLFSSTISSWICCFFWLLHTFTLIGRIIWIADFRLVEVLIMSKSHKPGSNLTIDNDSKITTGKIENGSSDTYLFDDKIKDVKSNSSLDKSAKERSPSFNYVDDSPRAEDNKSFSLSTMGKRLTDTQYNNKLQQETLFQAPRADISSL